MHSLIQEDKSTGVTAPNNYGLENYEKVRCRDGDDIVLIAP